MRASLGLAICAVLVPSIGWSGDKAPSKMDLGIPSFGEIPKAGDLKKATPDESAESGPSATSTASSYSVVHIIHAKALIRSPSGATAAGPALNVIPLSGKPLSTEKFTTVVRVKSPQKKSAPIEVTISDPRGDSALWANGELSFRGVKGNEADYVVDWDPTPCRSGGEFKLMVKVGGQVLGTWPMKFSESAK